MGNSSGAQETTLRINCSGPGLNLQTSAAIMPVRSVKNNYLQL